MKRHKFTATPGYEHVAVATCNVYEGPLRCGHSRTNNIHLNVTLEDVFKTRDVSLRSNNGYQLYWNGSEQVGQWIIIHAARPTERPKVIFQSTKLEEAIEIYVSVSKEEEDASTLS